MSSTMKNNPMTCTVTFPFHTNRGLGSQRVNMMVKVSLTYNNRNGKFDESDKITPITLNAI